MASVAQGRSTTTCERIAPGMAPRVRSSFDRVVIFVAIVL